MMKVRIHEYNGVESLFPNKASVPPRGVGGRNLNAIPENEELNFDLKEWNSSYREPIRTSIGSQPEEGPKWRPMPHQNELFTVDEIPEWRPSSPRNPINRSPSRVSSPSIPLSPSPRSPPRSPTNLASPRRSGYSHSDWSSPRRSGYSPSDWSSPRRSGYSRSDWSSPKHYSDWSSPSNYSDDEGPFCGTRHNTFPVKKEGQIRSAFGRSHFDPHPEEVKECACKRAKKLNLNYKSCNGY